MDLLRSFGHPEEVCALVKHKVSGLGLNPKSQSDGMSLTMQTCYKYLKLTSRSFAAVIQALDDELRDAVCIFYLVLRALDTVEDDMTIDASIKKEMLIQFHTHLVDPSWKFLDSHEKDRIVLEDFTVISTEFSRLKPLYREVITDICKRMGAGMTVFLSHSPSSMAEWDEYCHYVAGLVGIGLSRIFSASGLEDGAVGENTALSNSMGLFLQKTNIIRDYLEDIQQNRKFWPQEVLEGTRCQELLDLADRERQDDALLCLNRLVTNALSHVPDVITYLSRLQNHTVFNFCAIPQVMAIATLERCYDNPAVFERVVKIRRGEAVRLMQHATNVENVKAIFAHFCRKIQERVPCARGSGDSLSTEKTLDAALVVSRTHNVFDVVSVTSSVTYLPLYVSVGMVLAAIAWQFWVALTNILTDLLTDSL